MNVFFNSFNIRLIKKKHLDSFLFEGETILDLKADTTLLKINPTVIFADPFLFVHNDELYLFYEHQRKWIGGKGVICMKKTSDLLNWSAEQVVLDEPFHLSFPFVFADAGSIYMIPETGVAKSVFLYEAMDGGLTKWGRKVKLIDDGRSWYDSSVCRYEGMYYLFSSVDVEEKQEQHLFVSQHLTGPYKEHPLSPIYYGNDGGRNGGSVFGHEGHLFRPVQVCMKAYGEQLSMMRITSLTPDYYQEVMEKNNIFNTSEKRFKYGGHHFNAIRFLDSTIIAIDYRSRNYNVIEFFKRLRKLLKLK